MDFKRIAAFLLVVVVAFGIFGWTSPDVVKNIRLGLDLKGGFEILYKASPLEKGGKVTKDQLNETAKSLMIRANAFGVSEPEITTEGADRIRVQLAGVENEQQVRDQMKEPANLTFRSQDGCSDGNFCKIELKGDEFVPGAAKLGYDSMNNPEINIEVKDKAKFAEITKRLLGQPLAIYLDEQQLSAPVVRAVLTDGKATISGNYTTDEATKIRDIINLGALPVQLSEMYTQRVGPTLGQLSLHQTLMAGLIGSIFILLFMLVMYRVPGIVASITLIGYTWLLLVVFYWMQAALTLPGIAAFVLGIGMAVDANIITYERIKEEIRSGKSILSSLKAGSRNSFRTIIDANVTTIIAGLALYFIGTGSIRGFALTLIFSILVSIFTNVFLSRVLLNLLIKGGAASKPGAFGVKASQISDISKDGRSKKAEDATDRIDLIGRRKIFMTFSAVITVLGIVTLLVFNLNYGVDFKSGTRIDINVGQAITKQEALDKIAKAGISVSKNSVTVGGQNNDRVSIRFDKILSTDEEHKVTNVFGTGNAEVNTVDPTIARELGVQAIKAVLIACIGIILYVSIRFEWRYALAAIVALLHDAFIVISLFSIFRLEVDLTFVAAVLTIIGYSINDTIVIFDRIRENMKFAKIRSYGDLLRVVNHSVVQTLARSVNTIITVLAAALCLFIFGSPSIRMFSLAMILGLISGGYSSIFIASPVWIWLRKTFAPHPAGKKTA